MFEDKKRKIKGFSKMSEDKFSDYTCGFRTKCGKNPEKNQYFGQKKTKNIGF